MTTTLLGAARWHRPLMIFTGIMGVTAVVALVGIFVDPRILTGVPIWLKPFKFAISLGIYGLTIAWMLSLLPSRSRVAEWAATVIVAMSAIEMVVIVGQVIRGQTSHYNDTTPLNSALWSAMGVAITVLFAAHLVIAVAAARQRIADRAATYAVRLGLGLSLLGMLAAVPMVLPGQAPAGGAEGISGAHTVGLPDGGPGLPLVGWSTAGGDLRVGHFVGLHALQALPLLAIALYLLRNRLDEAIRVRLLLVAGAAYAALTVSLTWQALRGQSLVHPDALTLAVWGTLAVATAAAGALVVRRRTAPVPVLAPEPARVPERLG
jgi:hypothetical protein